MRRDDRAILRDAVSSGLSGWIVAGSLALNPALIAGASFCAAAGLLKGLQSWRHRLNCRAYRSFLEDSCE